MTLEFKTSKPEKIGLMTETVYTFKNSDKRDLSIYDLKNIQNELYHQAKKKNGKNCIVEIVIKCLCHQWLTFTNEAKFDAYFDNMVKDTSKFESFSQIQYYVSVQKPKK
jgi:hypothetical protein